LSKDDAKMNAVRFGEIEHVIPLVAPIDTGATEKGSPFIKLLGILGCTFLVFFGVVTAASADQNITVTVTAASSAASTNETAMPFMYRKSSAVGTDTWGAVTAATSAGVSLDTTADDNKLLIIEVDPRAAVGVKANASYIRAVVTPDAGATVTLCSIIGFAVPRYAGLTMQSAS
jgi:hypothetical protein